MNLALFQSVWLINIIGASSGNEWLGIISLLIFILIHSLISTTYKVDFKLAALAIIFGLIIETLIIQSNLLAYLNGFYSNELAPLWLLCLWANLALTFNGCLSWLNNRYLLGGFLGAIGAPLSYYAGITLGAATVESSLMLSLSVIAVIYGAIIPIFLLINKKLSQHCYS
ncbi:MAG: DUF2878 domain-containing protein [Pseudomonadota bacterium]|nr:DUF2878 domain-containing protein [Pseudomonadota bacterium]